MQTMRQNGIFRPSARRLALLLLIVSSAAHVGAAVVLWTNALGDDWNTVANWSTGALPGPNDDVVIDRPGEITVTHSSGTHTVRSLLSQEAFQLSGGSLTVSNTVQVNNTFKFSRGILQGATILKGSGGQLITLTNNPTFDRVTLGANLSVAENTTFYIINGLTLADGTTITVNSPSGFGGTTSVSTPVGTATIAGTGQIVLAGSSASLTLGNASSAGTVGSNVTVRGRGSISGSGSTLINQGTIQADVAGQTLTVGGNYITNSGTLKALNGATMQLAPPGAYSSGSLQVSSGSTLNFYGSATFGGGSSLLSQPSGTLRLVGNLLGTTQTPLLFSPQGSTTFYGFGTPVSPQLLEVMSPDVGTNAAGFSGPFAYGTLSLASSTYVRLVDQADNSPGAAPEALYVNALVVPAGCTLDLHGLHLYARATNITGNVTGGPVSLIPDGGPLVPDVLTPGALVTAGEMDEWTFFARAGQFYTITVDTGSGSVILPALNFGEVRLLDPSGGTLARGSNTVARQIVAFPDVQTPVEGTYRIQVRAPANQPAATGNYLIALWADAPNVASLMLNQTMNGRLRTPFSEDRWTFSAVAGQQVRFDLVNVSAPGVAFDLGGPNGWIGFSNLTAGSGLVTLLDSGSYTLTAHGTGGSYGNAYAFRLVETIQTDLAIGGTFAGNFAGSGQAQIFRVVLSNSTPLRITLTSSGTGNRTELYVGGAAPPTRGVFDFSAASGPGVNRDILIPSAPAGTLYVLVYGDQISTPGAFTIQVTAANVFLKSITPTAHAYNAGFTMTLTGAGFEAGTSVELVGSGGLSAGAATNVSVDSFTQLTATFPPNLALPGFYSVRVHQPDGDSATLTNAFTLLDPGEPRLTTRLIMPGNLGRHAVATLYVEYANEGTVAMSAPLLVLKSADPDGSDRPILTLDQSRWSQAGWLYTPGSSPPGTANAVFILASGAQPGVLNAGERFLVPVYYLGLQQPWDFSDSQIEMEIRYWTTDDLFPIDWAARKESLRPPRLDAATWDVVYANLTAELATTGDYVRMLDKNAQYLGQLGQRVTRAKKSVGQLGPGFTDAAALWNFELQRAYGSSVIAGLGSAVDSVVAAPGLPLELSRRFSRARNSVGWFGRGWYTPWQARLVAENFDIVTLVGEAGSSRVFTPDARTGGYSSEAGDNGTLAAVGGLGSGVYELREPDGIVARFRADGKVDYVQDPNTNRVTASYDAQGGLVMLSHTSGGWISLGYNGAGLVAAVTNSDGRILTCSYDPAGPYLLGVTTDDGKVTSYTYETAGTLGQRHTLLSMTRNGVTRQFTYDTQGRVASTFLGAGEQLVQFGYDRAGGVTSTDAQGTSQLFLDHRGLPAKVIDPLGNLISTEYNDDLRLSRLVLPSGESRSFTWCDCGSPTSLTDELGHTTTFQHDNPFKRLTSLTDTRGKTTAHTYDSTGNLLSTVYPDNATERFGRYTASGLAQSYTNRRGQAISYTYTPSGQLDRQAFADGSFADFDYDPHGNLTNVLEHPLSGPDKVTTYGYDYAASGGRLRKVTYLNGRWVEFFYDAFGRRERLTDSTGQDLRYDYNTAGQLWRLRDAASAVLVEYLYNSAGRLQRINKGNGSYATYDYDAAGHLLHLVNYAPSAAVNSRFDYTYDRRGRRTAMGTLDGDWTYEYDATGQLIRAVFASRNVAIPNQDHKYTYDPAGNRTAIVANGVSLDYGVNNLDQYTSVGGTNFQYDADGNLTSDGARTYEYDAQNRLTRITAPEGVTVYEYDAFGNRIATVFNGQRTEYLLDPHGWGDVIAEFNGSGLVAHYVYGAGLVNRALPSNAIEFYDFDAIGSVVSRVGTTGSADQRAVYEPFGTQLALGPTGDPFGFLGQFGLMAAGTDLVLARHRFVSARLGRFLTQDPTKTGGGDVNLYRYGMNNPVSLGDINGLWSFDIGAWAGDGEAFTVDLLIGFEGFRFKGFSICTGAGAGLGAGAGVGVNSSDAGASVGMVGGAAIGLLGGSLGLGNTGGLGSLGLGPGGGGYLVLQGCTPAWCPWCDEPDKPPKPPGSGAGGGGGGGGGSGGAGGAGVANSIDPNGKFGTRGVGSRNWISRDTVIPYRINFENLGPGSVDGSGTPYSTFATAPAQLVTIADKLDAGLDWSTFQLTELGFGDTIVPIPSGRTHYAGSVSMTYNGHTFNVELEAGIDLGSGRAFAVFQSIDPQTSLPPDVLTGFLPPEDGTGRGQGHMSFLINMRTNLPTGTQIRNVALIEFDRQMSIATDQVNPHNPGAGVDANKQALNTIDAGAPSSSVRPLPVESGRTFTVNWSGLDDSGGSGIASYDVFVSTNSGGFALWQQRTTNASALFTGELGKAYAFYSIARDFVQNEESAPLVADAQTMVVTNAPLLAALTNLVIGAGESLSISNAVQGTPVGSFIYSLGPFAPDGASINPTNGLLTWTPTCSQGSTTNTVTVWVTDSGRTNISDAVIFTVIVRECVLPQLGRLVLRAGDSGRLPLHLISSVPLTNLAMCVSAPAERLVNLGVEPIAPEVCTNSIQSVSNSLYLVTLQTCSNQFLIGTQQVAWLVVTAVTNQHSAFVPVLIGPSIGTQPGGTFVTNFVMQAGRVVVVGEEPLLEALGSANRQVQLVLYTIPGTTNVLETAGKVPPQSSWLPWQQVTPTNLWLNVPLAATNNAQFIRALRQ